MVGNEFVVPARLPAVSARVKLSRVRDEDSVPVIPVEAISHLEIIPVTVNDTAAVSQLSKLLDLIHRQSFIVFAALFLLVAASGIEVGGRYWAAQVAAVKPVSLSLKHTIAGLNLTIPAAELQSKLQSVTGQPASLTVGSQTVAISPSTIKSWLKITGTASKGQDYIHIDSQAMAQSLTKIAGQFASAPVNQVTVTHGGVSQVILAGQNGATLTNPASLSSQAGSLAKTVMNGKGLQFSTPLASQPFQAVTPAAFSKMIEVDVDTHQMYLYDNGNLTSTYAVSAGAPATPTPIGEFHIWEKLTSQTMKGTYPVPYVQPNVPWINYFDHNGDAIHGNYWRPASVFGNVNTSHGCVSLPVSEAETVYNWTTIGTTVITHY